MALEIRRLCDALGMEVVGADCWHRWRPRQKRSMTRSLSITCCVFRTDPLEPAAFARVARYFGDPQLPLIRTQRHGENPEVSVLESTYKSPSDKLDDLESMRLWD